MTLWVKKDFLSRTQRAKALKIHKISRKKFNIIHEGLSGEKSLKFIERYGNTVFLARKTYC